jgi:flagellar motor switch protein FliM
MPNVLSQEEIDALLEGLSDGKIETKVVSTPPEGIVTYDLASQDRIIRGRMPTLEMTNEKFARIFRGTLSSILRKVVNVSTMSTDMLKFAEFMKTLPVPTSIHLFKMNPLRGNAIFIVESKVIFALVDLMFGGSGTSQYKVEGREFTPIENNLIKKIVLSALSDLENSWSSLADISISYMRSEINPQFAQIVPPTEVVVVINYELEIEYTTGIVSICIPYASLEPVKEKLLTGYQSESMEVDMIWQTRFKNYLLTADVDLVVQLGSTKISGRELLNLQEGDVIRLDQFADDPLTAFVEGVAKYKVFPGHRKGNMAGKIHDLIKKEDIEYGTK